MLTCIVAFSMESNFGPSILGTLDTISISNRPTVLFGGILPAWRQGRRTGRGGGGEVGREKRGVRWRKVREDFRRREKKGEVHVEKWEEEEREGRKEKIGQSEKIGRIEEREL